MMAAEQVPPAALAERLPTPRGRLRFCAPLGARTWLRVGGPADALFQPQDEDDLADFLARTPADIPVSVVGAGSNLLVRDGGVRGVVIRLGGAMARVRVDGLTIRAGAGARDLSVALQAQAAGIGGFAFLSGVPGAIGGAVRMNAGAYGGEISDILIHVRAVDRAGHPYEVGGRALGFAYRHCAAPEDWIFTEAVMAGTASTPTAEAEEIARIKRERGDSQPLRARTGGSTFKNPPGEKAWALIDRAGCRGLRVGGARMSEKHCNFIIVDSGTAADVEALGEEVRRRVRAACGVDLAWELRRIGDAAAAS